MRICLVSRALSPESKSGIARATADLAPALAERGHDVHVITRSDGEPSIALDGVAVHQVLAPAGTGPVGGEPVMDHLTHASAVYRAAGELHEEHPLDAVVAPLWCAEGIVCSL